MIKISTSEVKEFIKRARPIKTYGIIPVLGYYRLDCVGDSASFTKTNNHTWVIHAVTAEFDTNISVLIEEKLLSALVSSTSSDTITITVEDAEVILSDGRSDVSFALEDIANYPLFPERNQDEGVSRITAEVLYAIRAATSIITTNLVNQFSFCYINPGDKTTDVFSTNNAHTMYRKSFDLVLPPIVISPEAGAIVSGFEEVQHYTANNYDFFDCGKTTYGFIKSVYKCPAYKKPFSACTNHRLFEINRVDLLRFCELTVSSSPSQVPVIAVEDNQLLGVTFRYDDNDVKIYTRMDFEAEKNFHPEVFKFNPKILIPLLKAIDTEKIRWSPASPVDRTASNGVYCLWSAEDENLLTLLVGLGD